MAIPSTVRTRRPAQARPSTRQESTGVSSTSTVHVPHSPSSQPCLVPVRLKSSRSTSSNVLCGAKATSTGSPFTSSAIFALASGRDTHPKRNLDNRVVGRQLSRSPSVKVSMRAVCQLLGLAFLVSAAPPDRLTAQDHRAEALRILKAVPLIDGHNDIPDAIRARGGPDSVDFGVPQPKLMTDIPKLRTGGVGAQFWAADVPVTTMDSGPHPAVDALEQIDLIKRLCTKYPRDLAMAYRAADVERNFKAGKISCLIGIEGGHATQNSPGALRVFAAPGGPSLPLTPLRRLASPAASTA